MTKTEPGSKTRDAVRWEASRKRSSEEMSFKFLVKAGKAKVEIWSDYRLELPKFF
jgi:hypothetical protein